MDSKSTALTKISLIFQLIAWIYFIGAPLIGNLSKPHFAHASAWIFFTFQHLLLVVLFYYNYLYLIPKILVKRGGRVYITYAILTILLILILTNLQNWVTPLFNGKGKEFSIHGVIIIIQVYAASTAWRLFTDFIDQQLVEKQLKQEKKDAELKFLRSQINPHFLFNTLNNINALIRNKPDEAERSVVRLSFLMRYMLNSGQKNKVSLQDEIAYIENYIELQKLRLAADFKIRFELIGDTQLKEIEPLLLIGFIENTFKHGITGEDSDFIEIKIVISANKLLLITRNALSKFAADKNLVSGIGLQNTLNRLELCYKNSYRLNVSQENGVYSTHLEIDL